MTGLSDRDRLIVALDLATLAAARAMIKALGPEVSFYKVGLELVMQGGLDLVREIAKAGGNVFLDMKLLDIGNTVERATANAAETGARFLTVHGHDTKTMKAAVAGRGRSQMKLLAVTVLTSLTAEDLREQGVSSLGPADLVLHRARLARDSGFDGVIASGQEAARVRSALGPGFLIVTPGIRPAGGAAGDQKRITTPADAIRAGADHLVVGRPITEAPDPAAAARAILAEIAAAGRGSSTSN